VQAEAHAGRFLPAPSMRSHIAGHILHKDVKAFACGCCGAPPPGPGRSGCQPKLQGRRRTKREDQPDPALCENNCYRVFYSAPGSKPFKGMCTNVQMWYPARNADGTDTVLHSHRVSVSVSVAAGPAGSKSGLFRSCVLKFD
jgi:hypothetical protein